MGCFTSLDKEMQLDLEQFYLEKGTKNKNSTHAKNKPVKLKIEANLDHDIPSVVPPSGVPPSGVPPLVPPSDVTPTEASTEEPTEASTEKSSEASTEKSSEALTDASHVAPDIDSNLKIDEDPPTKRTFEVERRKSLRIKRPKLTPIETGLNRAEITDNDFDEEDENEYDSNSQWFQNVKAKRKQKRCDSTVTGQSEGSIDLKKNSILKFLFSYSKTGHINNSNGRGNK